MGLFDIFKRRSKKEAAVTQDELRAAGGSEVSGGGGGGSFEAAAPSAAAAIDLSKLGSMVKDAIDHGNVQIKPGDSKTIDLRGSGAREQIFEAMKKHGVDPSDHGKTIDASDIPGLQKDIMKILAEHGVNVPGSGNP